LRQEAGQTECPIAELASGIKAALASIPKGSGHTPGA